MNLPPPCKFYHAGVCFKGELCEFTHPVIRCKSFDAGFCQYGYKCHFRHDLNKPPPLLNDDNMVPTICPFFLAGQCKFGEHCALSHQIEGSELLNTKTLSDYKAEKEFLRSVYPTQNSEPIQSVFKKSNVVIAPNPTRPPVQRPTTRLEQGFLRDLTADDLEQMRNLEIDRFLKLFPPSHLKRTSSSNEEMKIYSLLFSSKDPDWPFEVKQILLNVIIPGDYPVSPPKISAPPTSSIPDSVTNFLNEKISSHITSRHVALQSSGKVQLYLRSFFFWLDKALRNIFTDAFAEIADQQQDFSSDLKIPESFHESELFTGPSLAKSHPDVKPLIPISGSKASNEETQSKTENLKNVESDEEDREEDIAIANVQIQSLSFEGLEMRGHAGTGLFTRLPVQCVCSICKLHFDHTFRLPPYTPVVKNEGEENEKKPASPRSLTSLGPSTITCQRCRHALGLSFTAEHVHPFSSQVGTFQMANCTLIEVFTKTADVMLSCNQCNGEEVKVTGLQPDKVSAKRCQKCHSICGIFYTGLNISLPKLASADICRRFASMILNKSAKESTKPKRNQAPPTHKPVLIQKGTPLPNNGTCKHYEKSFRWLKFSCCQRAFPCDVCHDLEVAGAHETLYANRTICGFCSTEQPCQSGSGGAVCVSCGKKMVSSSSGNHWEGGRGCRDPVKMSRKDNRKRRLK